MKPSGEKLPLTKEMIDFNQNFLSNSTNSKTRDSSQMNVGSNIQNMPNIKIDGSLPQINAIPQINTMNTLEQRVFPFNQMYNLQNFSVPNIYPGSLLINHHQIRNNSSNPLNLINLNPIQAIQGVIIRNDSLQGRNDPFLLANENHHQNVLNYRHENNYYYLFPFNF